jgi:hypothetical protein
MKKSNLALKSDATSGETAELYPHDSDLPQPYIGGSSIRRLVRKTKAGQKIEDYLQEEVGTTSSTSEFLSEEPLMPVNIFELTTPSFTSHSVVLKKWNGYITSIDKEEFTAVLTDPLGNSPDMKVSFSIDEVSEGDRDLVVENALFDWVISRERKIHGQIENKDFLIFKRLPMWQKSDLDAKSAKVDAFNAWLNTTSTL